MRGTGSHDYTVTDVFIPDEYVHPAVERSAFRPSRSTSSPGWTHVAHAAIGLGIARVAIEEFVSLAGGKQATWLPAEGRLAGRTTVRPRWRRRRPSSGSARAYVREATRDTWETVCRGDRPSPEQRAVYRLSIAHAMDSALQAMDLMYTARRRHRDLRHQPPRPLPARRPHRRRPRVGGAGHLRAGRTPAAGPRSRLADDLNRGERTAAPPMAPHRFGDGRIARASPRSNAIYTRHHRRGTSSARRCGVCRSTTSTRVSRASRGPAAHRLSRRWRSGRGGDRRRQRSARSWSGAGRCG